ncbi:TIGR03013 family PEP-CTERM/XrtA system glycosyltransferase [Desulfosarcina sp. OttesenSCG-928-G10]|nr:TIGR03013 family PEP-CTERM/XrtA system glycosyltransferase [Desulfosarcina sp. OttesenSCG-928-G10]
MLRIFKQYYPIRNILFVIGEGAFIFFSVLMAGCLLLGTGFFVESVFLLLKIFLVASICQICLYYNGLYDSKLTSTYREMILRLVQSLGIAAMLLALVYAVFPAFAISSGVFAVSICFIIAFIVLWRIIYTYILNHGVFNEKIMLLGEASGLVRDIARAIEEDKDCGYEVAALMTGDKPTDTGKPGYEDLFQNAANLKIDKIVVAIEERRGRFPVRELLRCRVDGIEVLEGTSFYEMLTGKLIVEKINPSWLIFSDGFRKSRTRKIVKRICDLVFSALMLAVLSPILAFVAVLIKLDSKGPVFFSQERVGENKKLYTIYKFRSMIPEAEEKTGPVWAKTNDSRVTRIGKFIRKWRIDELPQLFNVIKGEMSFVGPRPERAFFVKELETRIPYYAERFSVKPGVTGWAQVSYAYGASVEDAREKLNYDLFYIKNMTLLMDMMVILRTVKTVLFGEGAR